MADNNTITKEKMLIDLQKIDNYLKSGGNRLEELSKCATHPLEKDIDVKIKAIAIDATNTLIQCINFSDLTQDTKKLLASMFYSASDTLGN